MASLSVERLKLLLKALSCWRGERRNKILPSYLIFSYKSRDEK